MKLVSRSLLITFVAILFVGCGPTPPQNLYTLQESHKYIEKMVPDNQSDIVYIYSYLDYPSYISCTVNQKPVGNFAMSGGYQILRLDKSTSVNLVQCTRYSYSERSSDPDTPLGNIMVNVSGNQRHYIEVMTEFTPFQDFFIQKVSGESFDINTLKLTKECFDCYQ